MNVSLDKAILFFVSVSQVLYLYKLKKTCMMQQSQREKEIIVLNFGHFGDHE